MPITYDPANIRFASLRVINDDIVQPGTGFGTYGHRDMEILTYVNEDMVALSVAQDAEVLLFDLA